MTDKTLDDIMKKVLNDQDVFSSPYDRKGPSIPHLFEPSDWRQLKEYFEKKDKTSFDELVEKKMQDLRQKEKNAQGWRKKQIDNILSLSTSLKQSYQKKPHLLKELFETFHEFGLLECKLPNMEDYGKVIENHSRSTVEQFFLYKIDKAKPYEKRALKKILEYLKEMYSMNLDILEIAFFVRKLNSLSEYPEVIKDE